MMTVSHLKPPKPKLPSLTTLDTQHPTPNAQHQPTMITALTSPAPALSRDELAALSAATPSTFSDIPPLLRHQEESVHFSIDPPCQGFSSGQGVLTITEG